MRFAGAWPQGDDRVMVQVWRGGSGDPDRAVLRRTIVLGDDEGKGGGSEVGGAAAVAERVVAELRQGAGGRGWEREG